MKKDIVQLGAGAMGMAGSLRRLARGRWPLKIVAAVRRNAALDLEIVPDGIREFIDAHRRVMPGQAAVSR